MEFTGTKGKWSTKFGDVYSDLNEEDDAICDVYDWRTDEGKANALLISKAPEMLEMLNTVLMHNPCHYNDSWHQLTSDVKALIKSATEL